MTASIRSVRALTPRQREIAEMIGMGKSYREIADQLAAESGENLSWHTVRAHVRAIANLIDVDEGALTPRERILLLVRYEQWERDHKAIDVGAVAPL